jgi:hypothetical protein
VRRDPERTAHAGTITEPHRPDEPEAP